jgi:NAD(P)H-flavin reductase
MRPRTYRVTHAHREIPNTFTLGLQPEDGAAVPAFAPGQFNMLYVFGVGEIAISISGDPRQPTTLLHTVRSVGTVSRALRASRRDAVVGVRGPFGTAWPLASAEGKDVVLVAGGIGLAPLRPVIYHLMAERERYGRLTLLYGARSPADILYRRELHQWRARLDLDVLVTVDQAVPTWRGSVGVVTRLIARALGDAGKTVAMVCGPEIMMRLSAAELLTRGVAPDSIYVSIERNMKCALGFCGHCQLGSYFVCKDGPVFPLNRVHELLLRQEV